MQSWEPLIIIINIISNDNNNNNNIYKNNDKIQSDIVLQNILEVLLSNLPELCDHKTLFRRKSNSSSLGNYHTRAQW